MPTRPAPTTPPSANRKLGGGWLALVLAGMALAAGGDTLRAGTISIPNASFESPLAPYVNIHVDAWQKAPKPAWYDESGPFTWDQLAGTFKNTAPGSTDHIGNCDGSQAVWLFAVPEVALLQDHDSVAWNETAPSHAFAARFEVGKRYDLTVGVIGGGGGMSEGVSLKLSLYYRDDASNQVTVAATTITHSGSVFSNATHFVDFQVQVPTVRAGDPWADRHLGVRIESTVSMELQGGYWDVDNVRLSATVEPTLTECACANGRFQFTLHSEPGLKFEILAATNAALPVSAWTGLGTLTNTTGTARFTNFAIPFPARFYRARQVP